MPQSHPSILSFLDHLKYQKRYSRHTLESYENDLISFLDFTEVQFAEPDIKKIKPAFVKSWLASMKENGMASRSINRKISSLRSFFKYLLKEGVITTTPMVSIISPKISKRLPQFVEEADMDTLFKSVEFPDTWKGKTDRLVLQILYNTGLRQAELISLKEHNIDISNSNIKVLGKGSKERVIPISNEMIASIRQYLADKKDRIEVPEKGYLLVNEKGKKLYPRYVYDLVRKYLSYVTTIDKKSPHILRHTFATHLTSNGAEINAVKELLGHSSLAATQIYTHNTIDKLKEIHKKAHPKA